MCRVFIFIPQTSIATESKKNYKIFLQIWYISKVCMVINVKYFKSVYGCKHEIDIDTFTIRPIKIEMFLIKTSQAVKNT